MFSVCAGRYNDQIDGFINSETMQVASSSPPRENSSTTNSFHPDNAGHVSAQEHSVSAIKSRR